MPEDIIISILIVSRAISRVKEESRGRELSRKLLPRRRKFYYLIFFTNLSFPSPLFLSPNKTVNIEREKLARRSSLSNCIKKRLHFWLVIKMSAKANTIPKTVGFVFPFFILICEQYTGDFITPKWTRACVATIPPRAYAKQRTKMLQSVRVQYIFKPAPESARRHRHDCFCGGLGRILRNNR